MTRKELADCVASELDIPKVRADKVVKILMKNIQKALVKGERIVLSNFGTLYVQQLSERTGVNFHTGEPIHIPAMKRVGFKIGKALKNALN